jgi:hypothetical protein
VQCPAAPRPTLPATLDSLIAAGIAPRVVFQEAPTVVGHLTGILEAAPLGGHLVRLEDDVEVGLHIAHNLQAWSAFGTRVLGFLYHCPKMPGNNRGAGRLRTPPAVGDCIHWPRTAMIYGACGLYLRGDVAHELTAELHKIMADPPPYCVSRKAGRLMQDQSLCEAAYRLGIPLVAHAPPLVEHRGGACSTWRPAPYPAGTGSTCGLWQRDWKAHRATSPVAP